MEHQVATDHVARVSNAGSSRIGEQEESRVFDRARGEDVARRGVLNDVAVRIDALDGGDGVLRAVHHELRHARLREEETIVRQQRLAEHRDCGGALRVDRAAVVAAVAAVGARGPAVVRLRVHRGRIWKPRVPARRERGLHHRREVHRHARRHRVVGAARRLERIRALQSLHAELHLRVRVERLEIRVRDRPIGEACILHLVSEERRHHEILRLEARHLHVRVDHAAADVFRQTVHVADGEAIAVARRRAPRARVHALVDVDEAPHLVLELVVRVLGNGLLIRIVERVIVVRARFDDEHLEAALRAEVRDGSTARAAADDDDVERAAAQRGISNDARAHENFAP